MVAKSADDTAEPRVSLEWSVTILSKTKTDIAFHALTSYQLLELEGPEG